MKTSTNKTTGKARGASTAKTTTKTTRGRKTRAAAAGRGAGERTEAIAVFTAGDRTVRLLAPTPSCAYYTATFYLPGQKRQQRTTLGRDLLSATTWCEAKAREISLVTGMPDPERPYSTVRTLVEAFLDPKRNGRNWKPGTLDRNRDLARLLPAHLLELECRHLTEEALQNVIDEFADGHERSYVETFRSFLTGLVSFATKRKWLLRGQLEGLSLIVPRDHDDEELDGAVDRDLLPATPLLEQLVATMRTENYQLLVKIALSTGLRFSELAALRWDDVDLTTGKIRVNKALVENNKGKKTLTSTKNRRRRTVVFDRACLASMTDRVAAAKTDRVAGGLGLIFPSPGGGHISRNNFGKRYWRPAVAEVGLLPDGFHFHQLRHCAAVAMLDDLGMSISTVSAILGHRDVGVTERIYLKGRHGYADLVANSMGWGPAA